jgi:hypothetical protein
MDEIFSLTREKILEKTDHAIPDRSLNPLITLYLFEYVLDILILTQLWAPDRQLDHSLEYTLITL